MQHNTLIIYVYNQSHNNKVETTGSVQIVTSLLQYF